MKRLSVIAFLCICISLVSTASSRYWVGPLNGDWSSPANWSNTANGPGGYSVPGVQDTVLFSNNSISLIHIDASPTIASMRISGSVTLHASSPVVFTLLNSLSVPKDQILKDSTSADVSFRTILNGATAATANITGTWVFEGEVSVSGSNPGASLAAEPGSKVLVSADNSFIGGQLVFKRNSGAITSTGSSLIFDASGYYVLDGKLQGSVPMATWDAGSNLTLLNNIESLQGLQAGVRLGSVTIDLKTLSADLDLGLPDGTQISGNLEIDNTNNHTVTLLGNSSPSVTVKVSAFFYINGNTTKVALAKGTAAAPGLSYNLVANYGYEQSGGNFSLQEYDGATGSSTFTTPVSLTQTGGTFYTNSNTTSPTAKLTVVMSNPPRTFTPSGNFNSVRYIKMSSGSIDNAAHNVTLAIDHTVYLVTNYETNPNGVILQSPLAVGRLELSRSPLTTSSVNILSVNNPSPDAITIGGPSGSTIEGYSTGPTYASYVNGPLRRATNSTQPYFFPTGKGNYYMVGLDFQTYANSFIFDSCYVIPTSSTPSMYQAEYFRTGYPDISVTAPLLSVAQNEYFDFKRIFGADAQVKLKLRTPVITTAGSNSLVAAQYVNGHWSAAQGSTINACDITDSFVVSKPLSDLTPFAFGYLADASIPTVPANRTRGLAYKFYQGTFTSLPDFNAVTPITTGSSTNVNISDRPSGTDYNYAFKWEGYINIVTPGTYTFETISDDGSKVYFNAPYCLNAAALVNNDGVHGAIPAKGTINITSAGVYPITITYFQNYSGQSMQLFWTGPGISRRAIPDSVFTMVSGITPPQAGTGLNYKYYEGSFDVLPDFSTLTPVKTGNTPNVDISVRPDGVIDNFAFTWEGIINIPTSGTYTFETISDDGSKLYFNGSNIVTNDGLHPPLSATGNVTIAAGIYPISISFFEKNGGETMQVYWSGPGIARQLIPNSAFGPVTPPTPDNGLNYKYYEGDFDMLPDFNTLTPVKTGNTPNINIGIRPQGVDNHFAFVWEGNINLPAAGTYTFETISDDGSKVYFNMPYSATGNSLVTNDGLHAPNAATGTVTVPAAGSYPITVTFFEKDGGETMQLYWTGPGISRQLVPDAAFTSGSVPPVSSTGLNYKYYEGDFDVLPDYSSLTPVKTGTTANVDISIRTPGVDDHFAFIWEGYINLPAPGTYTFETISDDGSKVYFNSPYSVNGSSLVDNDGLHAPLSVSGSVTVPSAGRYPISITFFEKTGGETMQLYWMGPGINRALVPDAAFTTNNTALSTMVMSEAKMINLISNPADGRLSTTKAYPNPFAESFTIDYFNAGSVTNKISIGLYDLNGRLVYSYQPKTLLAGYNRWVLSTLNKKLVPGVYIAKLNVNGIPATTIKLVKSKL